MAKIKLGDRPKNFKRVVKVPMHDGTDGFIEALYKYRTLTEFGAYIDTYAKQVEDEMAAEKAALDAKRAEAEKTGDAYVEPALSNEDLRQKQAQASADYLTGILDGWNLDVGFSAETLLQLCDELPAAASQIINDYRLAITEGRLGN